MPSGGPCRAVLLLSASSTELAAPAAPLTRRVIDPVEHAVNGAGIPGHLGALISNCLETQRAQDCLVHLCLSVPRARPRGAFRIMCRSTGRAVSIGPATLQYRRASGQPSRRRAVFRCTPAWCVNAARARRRTGAPASDALRRLHDQTGRSLLDIRFNTEHHSQHLWRAWCDGQTFGLKFFARYSPGWHTHLNPWIFEPAGLRSSCLIGKLA